MNIDSEVNFIIFTLQKLVFSLGMRCFLAGNSLFQE